MITTLILSGILIYDKLFHNVPNTYHKCDTIVLTDCDNVDTNCECPVCEKEACNCPDSTCKTAGKAGSQLLRSEMGDVYVSEGGDVYWNPYENVYDVMSDETPDFREYAKTLLGTPKSFNIVDENHFIENGVFSYKLYLANVRSVSEFYFGNGGTNFALLFIHANGNVSELSFDGNDLKLYKNVSGYTNILSMVRDGSDSGNGAILYDKCGMVFITLHQDLIN